MKKKMLFNEKIFIAGSTGMVGRSVVKTLNEHGYGSEKYSGSIITTTRKSLDLLDSQAVSTWFKKNKPTIVIIAAAKVGGILANNKFPYEFLLENIKIQTNLIDAAFQNNVKRLLFLGSSCIYPKFADQPITEESLLTGSLENTNEWYAIAKISGLKMCESLRKQYKFDSISLMPTNLYGPNDNYHPTNSHVLAALIKKFNDAVFEKRSSVTCWGSGTPLREFMHVDDLSEAIIFALENWDPSDEHAPIDSKGNPLQFLNVGTGEDISIKKLAEKIAEISNFKGEILWDKSKPDGTPKKQLNIDKLKNLGWSAKIDLESGLRKTIKEYKKTFNK